MTETPMTETPLKADKVPSRPFVTFLKQFGLLFAVGFLGVLAILPTIVPVVQDLLASVPDAPALPLAAVVILSLINPSVLLGIGVVLGIVFAPRVGFRSHLAARAKEGAPIWPGLRSDLPLALAWGAVAGVLIVVGDALTRPLLGGEGATLAVTEGRTFLLTLAGVLYGGITEELVARWGLMSLFAWLLWRIANRSAARPAPAVMWSAIMLAAVAFGVLHVPAVAAAVPLTTAIILRTVVLNSVGGVIYGWLFWRRSLEGAMAAHAAMHLTMTLIAVVGSLG